MYVTLEKDHGRGELLHISRGKITTLLDGLEKPDGMLRLGNSLYITNESGKHGIIEYKNGTPRYFHGIHGAEGIAAGGKNHLLVVEDGKTDGRLLRVDEPSGAIEVLLTGLHESEGVCKAANGDIFFVEKAKSHLARYRNGQVSFVIDGLIKPGFLNCMDDGSILITEDRTNFGRLLRYRQGNLDVIATNLHSPQSVVAGRDGSLYLAEQRRKRILRFYTL